jgi:hypothetical protein
MTCKWARRRAESGARRAIAIGELAASRFERALHDIQHGHVPTAASAHSNRSVWVPLRIKMMTSLVSSQISNQFGSM